MDPRYVFVYAAVNVFCTLLCIIIISKIDYNVGSEHENRYFRGMVLSFLGFVLLELLWVLVEGGALPLPRAAGSSFKALSTVLIPYMVYLWFWFAEIKFRSHFVGSWLARIVIILPFAFLIVVYISSIFTGVVFSLGPEGELVPGPAVGLTGLVDNIYGIAIIVHAIILLVREKVPYRRRDYIAQIVFIVLCTAGGLIDAAVTGTPIMPLAIALAFVFLFSSLQENQIYNDALTGLNNRRRADEYVEESIAAATEERPLYLFMLDINNFKHINDTRGHLEGDRVLQAAACGIAKATDEFAGFAARWGGDEFVVAVSGEDPALPERIRERIHACVSEATRDAGIDYALTASIGITKCTSSEAKLSDLISRADRSLYEQKRAYKASA